MNHRVPLTLSASRVLVTGAAGFIGANLVRRLLHLGCEVHALVRPSTRLWRIEEIRSRLVVHQADVLDVGEVRTAFDRAQPQAIFHLASVRGYPVDPEGTRQMLRTSVEGTYNVLDAAAGAGVGCIVHVGSSLEYGARASPLKETDTLEPITLRGSIKAAQTLLCLTLARSTGLPVSVLRAFSVYGPWEPAANLIPTAIVAALRGREIALTPVGYRRDLVFVDDVVDACLRAAETDAAFGEVTNIGSGRQWSNEEVVELVGAITGQNVRSRAGAYPLRPSDTAHWVADITKARRLLGWEPRHDLRRGLEKTVAWLSPRLDFYDVLFAGRVLD
jgi:nucleoside-diphosphate-sugar epimerase